MKYLLLILIMALMLIPGCKAEGEHVFPVNDPDEIVLVSIIKGGIEVSSIIEIDKCRTGRYIDVIYRVENKTPDVANVNIYYLGDVKPWDYSKAENYTAAPPYIAQCVTLKSCGELGPYSTGDCYATLMIPESIDDIPEKFAFQICAENIGLGLFRPTIPSWWLVSMR